MAINAGKVAPSAQSPEKAYTERITSNTQLVQKEIRSLRLERSIRGSVTKRLYAKLFGHDIRRKTCPFDKALKKHGIKHKLIPPRTLWHNGKVERGHRNDQRYFYDWETFKSIDEVNEKLAKHLIWSNNKPKRTLGDKSPVMLLAEKAAPPAVF